MQLQLPNPQKPLVPSIRLKLTPSDIRYGMELQRSPDNVTFTDLDFVQPGQYTNGAYVYDDQVPQDTPTYYYRVRHIAVGQENGPWSLVASGTVSTVQTGQGYVTFQVLVPITAAAGSVATGSIAPAATATSASFAATASYGNPNFIVGSDPGGTALFRAKGRARFSPDTTVVRDTEQLTIRCNPDVASPIFFESATGSYDSWIVGMGAGDGTNAFNWYDQTAGATRFRFWGNGRADILVGPLVIGTDPGGASTLRVGGSVFANAEISAAPNVSSGSIITAFQSSVSYGLQLAGSQDNNAASSIWHNADATYNNAGGAGLKWRVSHASFGSRGIWFDYTNPPGGAAGGIAFYADNVVTTAGQLFTPTIRLLIRNDGDVTIGSLGTLQASVAPTADQLLSYSNALAKWVPRTLQNTSAVGVVGASTLTWGQVSFVNTQPAMTGAPPAGPYPAPGVTSSYNGFLIDMGATVLPANCKYVLGVSASLGPASGTFLENTVFSTDPKLVLGDLTQSAQYIFHYYISGNLASSGSTVGPSANSSPKSPSSQSEANVFGIVLASQIAAQDLAAITANIGTITAGYLQDSVNSSSFDLNNSVITIKDGQATSVTRVKVGKVAGSTVDYGLQVFDATGSTILDATGNKRIFAVPVQPIVNSGAGLTLDLSSGLTQQVILTATVASVTMSNPTNGGRYRVWLQQDATGSRLFPTMSNASNVNVMMFTNDTPPALTATPGAFDLFELEYRTSPTARFTCMPLQSNVLLPSPQVLSLTGTPFTSLTTHSVTMPATVNAGDLLALLFVRSGSSAITGPTGWTRKDGGVTLDLSRIYVKLADGSEGGTTPKVLTAASESAAAQVYRITRWQGNIADVVVQSNTNNVSTTPTPLVLTPSWAIDRTLWIAAEMSTGNPGINAYPASYNNGTLQNDSATHCNVASATRNRYILNETPGTFTLGLSETWDAHTIAIQPPP